MKRDSVIPTTVPVPAPDRGKDLRGCDGAIKAPSIGMQILPFGLNDIPTPGSVFHASNST